MKTERFLPTLGRLGACSSGYNHVKVCATMEEAWNTSEDASHLLWLWTVVGFAYPKETNLHEEIVEMTRLVCVAYDKWLKSETDAPYLQNTVSKDDIRFTFKIALNNSKKTDWTIGMGMYSAVDMMSTFVWYNCNDIYSCDKFRKIYRAPTDEELEKVIKVVNRQWVMATALAKSRN